MCVPGGGNPFATNNSGGGVPLQTALPNPNPANLSTMAPPGQYTPYVQPNWITSGLQAANQPLTNYPVTNYGRWNWGANGLQNTNGYGMNSSPWQPLQFPSAQGYGAETTAQPQGGTPTMQNQAMPPTGMGTPYSGQPGTVMPQAAPGANQAAVQQAGQAFAGMSPSQQASYLAANPRMAAAMRNAGVLDAATVNNLFGGSQYQTLSGQPLQRTGPVSMGTGPTVGQQHAALQARRGLLG